MRIEQGDRPGEEKVYADWNGTEEFVGRIHHYQSRSQIAPGPRWDAVLSAGTVACSGGDDKQDAIDDLMRVWRQHKRWDSSASE